MVNDDFGAESELVVHLVATGVVELAERSRNNRATRLPYPHALQRAIDRLVLLCLKQGRDAPASIPTLLGLCQQPLSSWPLALTEDTAGLSDRLISDGEPTQACAEWAVTNPDVEAELREQQLLGGVIRACRDRNSPETYVAFRKALIEHPVLTALEWQLLMAEPALGPVADAIRSAYLPAPPECLLDYHFHVCGSCGFLLYATDGKTLTCLDHRCAPRAPKVARILSSRDGVVWLRRELRSFVAVPGRSELHLAKTLARIGVAVDLWPNFDAYDLRINFADGESWAVDVKDWQNPFLLARSVQPIPTAPPWSRAFFVFPMDRLRRPDYLRAFRHHCPVLATQPMVEALGERQLITRVRARLKRMSNNA